MTDEDDAVAKRIKRGAVSPLTGLDAPAESTVLRIFDGLARAWALDLSERLALLGLGAPAELAELRQMPAADLPVEVVERIVCLLGIFGTINVLLPIHERADAWIRRPNSAALFGGRSALDLMLEQGLGGIHAVHAYLRGQLAGF